MMIVERKKRLKDNTTSIIMMSDEHDNDEMTSEEMNETCTTMTTRIDNRGEEEENDIMRRRPVQDEYRGTDTMTHQLRRFLVLSVLLVGMALLSPVVHGGVDGNRVSRRIQQIMSPAWSPQQQQQQQQSPELQQQQQSSSLEEGGSAPIVVSGLTSGNGKEVVVMEEEEERGGGEQADAGGSSTSLVDGNEIVTATVVEEEQQQEVHTMMMDDQQVGGQGGGEDDYYETESMQDEQGGEPQQQYHHQVQGEEIQLQEDEDYLVSVQEEPPQLEGEVQEDTEEVIAAPQLETTSSTTKQEDVSALDEGGVQEQQEQEQQEQEQQEQEQLGVAAEEAQVVVDSSIGVANEDILPNENDIPSGEEVQVDVPTAASNFNAPDISYYHGQPEEEQAIIPVSNNDGLATPAADNTSTTASSSYPHGQVQQETESQSPPSGFRINLPGFTESINSGAAGGGVSHQGGGGFVTSQQAPTATTTVDDAAAAAVNTIENSAAGMYNNNDGQQQVDTVQSGNQPYQPESAAASAGAATGEAYRYQVIAPAWLSQQSNGVDQYQQSQEGYPQQEQQQQQYQADGSMGTNEEVFRPQLYGNPSVSTPAEEQEQQPQLHNKDNTGNAGNYQILKPVWLSNSAGEEGVAANSPIGGTEQQQGYSPGGYVTPQEGNMFEAQSTEYHGEWAQSSDTVSSGGSAFADSGLGLTMEAQWDGEEEGVGGDYFQGIRFEHLPGRKSQPRGVRGNGPRGKDKREPRDKYDCDDYESHEKNKKKHKKRKKCSDYPRKASKTKIRQHPLSIPRAPPSPSPPVPAPQYPVYPTSTPPAMSPAVESSGGSSLGTDSGSSFMTPAPVNIEPQARTEPEGVNGGWGEVPSPYAPVISPVVEEAAEVTPSVPGAVSDTTGAGAGASQPETPTIDVDPDPLRVPDAAADSNPVVPQGEIVVSEELKDDAIAPSPQVDDDEDSITVPSTNDNNDAVSEEPKEEIDDEDEIIVPSTQANVPEEENPENMILPSTTLDQSPESAEEPSNANDGASETVDTPPDDTPSAADVPAAVEESREKPAPLTEEIPPLDLVDAKPELNELWVYADPLTVEASGPVDLATAKQAFFDTTMEVISQYFTEFLGQLLVKFNMKLTYLDSESAVLPFGVTGSTVLVKSYVVVTVDFKVASDNMDLLVAFTKMTATNLVTSFFSGFPNNTPGIDPQSLDPRSVLLESLDEVGIGLDSISVVEIGVTDDADESASQDGNGAGSDGDGSSDDGDDSESENDSGDEGDEGGEEDNTEVEEQDEGSEPQEVDTGPDTVVVEETGGPNTSLYAGIVSGSVILIALIAVVYSSRRRSRKWFNDALESVSGSLYSDGGGPPDGKVLPVLTGKGTATIRTGKTSSLSSQSTRSRIKPAAITTRSSSSRTPGFRSGGSVSTLGSFNMTLNPVLEKTGFEEDADSEERGDDNDSLTRMEDGPDLVASAALTCLDGNNSLGGMAANYPEFDLYNSPGLVTSASWSVDGLTINDDVEAEQQVMEETRRRRWREEADELIKRSVPGYFEGSGSSGTRSNLT